MNILITAATSAQAYKVKNSLSGENIIMGDHLELPAFMLNSKDMIRLPDPKSNTYTHEMLKLCLDRQIDRIYALRPDEAALLNEAGQLFNEYGIEVVHSS